MMKVPLTHPANLHTRLVVPGEGEAEVTGVGHHLVLLVESLTHILVRLDGLSRQEVLGAVG